MALDKERLDPTSDRWTALRDAATNGQSDGRTVPRRLRADRRQDQALRLLPAGSIILTQLGVMAT